MKPVEYHPSALEELVQAAEYSLRRLFLRELSSLVTENTIDAVLTGQSQ